MKCHILLCIKSCGSLVSNLQKAHYKTREKMVRNPTEQERIDLDRHLRENGSEGYLPEEHVRDEFVPSGNVQCQILQRIKALNASAKKSKQSAKTKPKVDYGDK